MKLLKKTVISAMAIASMLAFSSISFAAENKDGHAVVVEAAKNTEASLLAAKGLLEKGGETQQILASLNEARQAVKEFRYEATERARQKLSNELKLAREAFLKNDNAQTLVHVNQALTIYAEIKKIYDAAH
jgi:Spy/CpxP family protein refolding chaperone